ncbi:MAG: SRPBCC family protein, partial [Solirubrobacteraceae bacterium]
MSTVHAQIEIAAPPDAVWDTVMDPGRLGDWVTIHRSVTVLSPDPTAEGARMDQVLHVVGVSFRVHWTLEAVRPPREAEWHGRGPALSRAVIRYRLTGNREGPTTFDYVNEFHA